MILVGKEKKIILIVKVSNAITAIFQKRKIEFIEKLLLKSDERW